jgi:hypothetical protein
VDRRTYYHRNWPGSYYLYNQPADSYQYYRWPQSYFLYDGPGLAQPITSMLPGGPSTGGPPVAGPPLAQAVVVSYDPEMMKLIVRVGSAEKSYDLTAKTPVHDVDGSEIKLRNRTDKLKKDTKVDIEEKNGKFVGVTLKK